MINLALSGSLQISSTLSWSLYELSRHPQVQAKLYKEITAMMKDNPIPTAADVAKMPLLKAVMKETLRWVLTQEHKQPTPDETIKSINPIHAT